MPRLLRRSKVIAGFVVTIAAIFALGALGQANAQSQRRRVTPRRKVAQQSAPRPSWNLLDWFSLRVKLHSQEGRTAPGGKHAMGLEYYGIRVNQVLVMAAYKLASPRYIHDRDL